MEKVGNQLNKERVLLLLSGGMDSTTLAFWLKDQGYLVECIYFDFSQGSPNGERSSSISVARSLNANICILQSELQRESMESILKNLKDGTGIFMDVVILCIMAQVYAFNLKIGKIFLGVVVDDVLLYPSLQIEFFRLIENLGNYWMGNNIQILTPFLNEKKISVMNIGKNLNVPFEKTWSCSMNLNIHCGLCDSCLMRKKVFKELKLVDNTDYEF